MKLASEVLPEIRRTGAYQTPSADTSEFDDELTPAQGQMRAGKLMTLAKKFPETDPRRYELFAKASELFGAPIGASTPAEIATPIGQRAKEVAVASIVEPTVLTKNYCYFPRRNPTLSDKRGSA